MSTTSKYWFISKAILSNVSQGVTHEHVPSPSHTSCSSSPFSLLPTAADGGLESAFRDTAGDAVSHSRRDRDWLLLAGIVVPLGVVDRSAIADSEHLTAIISCGLAVVRNGETLVKS